MPIALSPWIESFHARYSTIDARACGVIPVSVWSPIAAISDGVLHYFLGGTSESARSASPFKNVVVAMLDLADGLELELNLGGGVEAGDGLEEFKRGFANAEREFHTQEIVCDAAAYEELATGTEATGFFPAYRG